MIGTKEMFGPSSGDLVIRTSDGVSLGVHKAILEVASPFWADLLSLPQSGPKEPSTSRDSVDVPEKESTMRAVLQLTYPISDPCLTSIEDITTVLEVAVKYEMTEPILKLQKLLLSPDLLKIGDNAVKVYAIACRFGLEECARVASRATLSSNILSFDTPLLEELKYITAFDYHRLLSLHRQRSLAAQSIIKLPDSVRCSQCSTSPHFGMINPPKWWEDFEKRAMEALRTKPTSDGIFDWEFLAKSAKAGCARCGTSMIECHDYFEGLRKDIDDLPDTI